MEELGHVALDETHGPGQQTMLAIIIGGERWHSIFLRHGARVMPPAAFRSIVADSLARGVRFDCNVLGQSAGALAQRDPTAAADPRQAIAGDCPATAS